MSNNFSSTQVNIRSAIQKAIGKTKSVLAGMTKEQAQEHLEVSRKNWIINGDMQVSQRGGYTSATAVTDATYYLDRWKAIEKTVSSNLTHTSSGLPSGVLNGLKIEATSAGTGTIGFQQFIEDYQSLHGKTVTVSAWVKSNTSYGCLSLWDDSQQIRVFHSGDGNWEKLTLTVVADSDVTRLVPEISIRDVGWVSITSGDYIEFTQVKLEIGDTATPFESRSEAEELALCQRYYYRVGVTSAYGNFLTAICQSSTDHRGVIYFPVEMRQTPTLNTSGSFALLGGATFSSIDIGDGITPTHAGLRIYSTTSNTSGNGVVLRADNDTTASIDFDTEL